jgi:hypothetical protein
MDLRHPFFGCLVEWSVSVKAYSMKMLAHPSLIFLRTKPSSGHCLPPLTRDLILTEARAGKSACARERATERALTQAAKLTTGRSGSGSDAAGKGHRSGGSLLSSRRQGPAAAGHCCAQGLQFPQVVAR